MKVTPKVPPPEYVAAMAAASGGYASTQDPGQSAMLRGAAAKRKLGLAACLQALQTTAEQGADSVPESNRQASLENRTESLEKLTKEQTDRQASLEHRLESLEKLTKEQTAEQGPDSVPANDRQASLENRMDSLEKLTTEQTAQASDRQASLEHRVDSLENLTKEQSTGKANGTGKSTGKGKLFFMGTLPPGVEVIDEHTPVRCEKARYEYEFDGPSWTRL